MSVSKVTICNNALSMIGGQQIASFEEDSKLAQTCRNIYDTTRLSILRSHPWSCAKSDKYYHQSLPIQALVMIMHSHCLVITS